MPFIRVDGVVVDYAVFEDRVKPLWKELMKKEDVGVADKVE